MTLNLPKKRSAASALHSDDIVGLTLDSLKQKGYTLLQTNQVLSFLVQALFFLVKTWCLLYPQCNSTAVSCRSGCFVRVSRLKQSLKLAAEV